MHLENVEFLTTRKNCAFLICNYSFDASAFGSWTIQKEVRWGIQTCKNKNAI